MNPGSEEAVSNGCKCPIIDNHHGKGYSGDGKSFIFSQDCTMHGERTMLASRNVTRTSPTIAERRIGDSLNE